MRGLRVTAANIRQQHFALQRVSNLRMVTEL
jgi:hypothetical protein